MTTNCLECESEFSLWLDWIEVTSEYRRQGFGRELVDGIESFLGGKICTTGGSDDGDAFCEAMKGDK